MRILTHSLIVYCHGGSKLSIVDTAYARHNWSKLHSALALAQHSSFFILRSSFFLERYLNLCLDAVVVVAHQVTAEAVGVLQLQTALGVEPVLQTTSDIGLLPTAL